MWVKEFSMTMTRVTSESKLIYLLILVTSFMEGHYSQFILFQMVTMKLRQPYTTASIWSSGKITCTGANSEDQVESGLSFFIMDLLDIRNVGGNCRHYLKSLSSLFSGNKFNAPEYESTTITLGCCRLVVVIWRW
jgi:hypothetical protein